MLISSSYVLFTVSSPLSVQSYRAARLNPRLTWDDPAYGMELMDLFEIKIPRHYGVQLHYICRDGYQTQDYYQRPNRPNYKSSANHPWVPQVPTGGGHSFWMSSHERWLPPFHLSFPGIRWILLTTSQQFQHIFHWYHENIFPQDQFTFIIIPRNCDNYVMYIIKQSSFTCLLIGKEHLISFLLDTHYVTG